MIIINHYLIIDSSKLINNNLIQSGIIEREYNSCLLFYNTNQTYTIQQFKKKFKVYLLTLIIFENPLRCFYTLNLKIEVYLY